MMWFGKKERARRTREVETVAAEITRLADEIAAAPRTVCPITHQLCLLIGKSAEESARDLDDLERRQRAAGIIGVAE